MKTPLKAFVVIALLAAVAIGCSKVEKILPQKDGTWELITTEHKEYVNGTLDTSYTDASYAMYNFNKEGVGVRVDTATIGVFDWFVNNDQDELTICTHLDTMGLRSCILYTVLESKKDNMVWFFTSHHSGLSTWSEETITLESLKVE